MRRRGFLLLGAALLPAFALRKADAGEEIPEDAREALESAKLIYVATRRKNGTRSEIEPIWFDYYEGDLYFTTSPESWKAKRIAAGSPLYIWVGGEEGPFLVGDAEKIEDLAVVERMGEAYEKKYWIAWAGLFRPRPDRVSAGKTIAYRVKLHPGTPPPKGS